MAKEVHVGDTGTKYRLRMQDEGSDFDPSDASIKRLIFSMPNGVVLVKDADVEVGEGDEDGRFYLTYTVTSGAGEDGAAFHAAAGDIRMQAYLRWADGQQYYSDQRGRDEDGRKLRVYPNLSDVST